MIHRKKSLRRLGFRKRTDALASSIAGKRDRYPPRRYGERPGRCFGDVSAPSRGGSGTSRYGRLLRGSESRIGRQLSVGIRTGTEAGMRQPASLPDRSPPGYSTSTHGAVPFHHFPSRDERGNRGPGGCASSAATHILDRPSSDVAQPGLGLSRTGAHPPATRTSPTVHLSAPRVCSTEYAGGQSAPPQPVASVSSIT